MLATLPSSFSLLSMRSAKPPISWSLAARNSASVGPSATKRAITSRAIPTASAAWSGRGCRPPGEGPAGVVGGGLQAHGEGAGVQAGGKVAVDVVAQAAPFTHLVGQARDKTASAQNVVAHQQ